MNLPIPRAHALMLLGTAPLAASIPVSAQTAPIRIATASADSYGEPYFGLDGGIFARDGLNVEITTLPNGGAIVQAMVGNAVDVGIGDIINAANSVNAGIPLVLLAGGGLYLSSAPTTLLFVSKSSTIVRAKDLEGQVVGVVALASISSLGLREWLRQNGADLEKIRFIEMPFPSMIPALGRGTIAAALLSEPFITAAGGDVRVLGKAFDAIAKSFYISAWFTTRDWLAKNPEAARRLVQAVDETARWSNAHHGDTAPILAKYTKLDLERIRTMTRVTFGTSLDPRLIQPILDVAYRFKELAKPVSAAELSAK
jgi:NitT/TauT family transport system substrate-binding protein